MAKANQGFTLIELMVAVSVLAVLLALAAPSFADFFDKSRVRGAADSIVTLIATARGDAVKRGRNVTLSMRGNASAWCMGANEAATPALNEAVATSTACDCTSSSACFVDGSRRVVTSTEFAGVTASAVTMTFVVDGKLGNLTPLGTHAVTLTSPAGRYQVQLNVSPLGQTRACTPSGQLSISGFPPC